MYGYELNIGGSEWIIIIFVALVLILGTGRLPGAARKIGKAVNEYNKAKSGIEEHVKNAQEISNNIPKISGPVESQREKLDTIARSIGVNPENKSDEDLQDIITKKMQNENSHNNSHDNSNQDNNQNNDQNMVDKK